MNIDRSVLNPYFKTYYTPNGVGNPCLCSPKALPLSKTSKLNTATNNTSISCRMRYAQFATSNGTTLASTSYPKKTCSLGGPTFSY
jgi:hypothetical protein